MILERENGHGSVLSHLSCPSSAAHQYKYVMVIGGSTLGNAQSSNSNWGTIGVESASNWPSVIMHTYTLCCSFTHIIITHVMYIGAR
jgi:hypothetical protein